MTTFTQLNARLKNFLMGRLLVLGIKECLVECATLCVKSEVMLLFLFCEDQKRVQNYVKFKTSVSQKRLPSTVVCVECINTMLGNVFCLTDVSITNGFQEKVFNNIVPIIDIFFEYIFWNLLLKSFHEMSITFVAFIVATNCLSYDIDEFCRAI